MNSYKCFDFFEGAFNLHPHSTSTIMPLIFVLWQPYPSSQNQWSYFPYPDPQPCPITHNHPCTHQIQNLDGQHGEFQCQFTTCGWSPCQDSLWNLIPNLFFRHNHPHRTSGTISHSKLHPLFPSSAILLMDNMVSIVLAALLMNINKRWNVKTK